MVANALMSITSSAVTRTRLGPDPSVQMRPISSATAWSSGSVFSMRGNIGFMD